VGIFHGYLVFLWVIWYILWVIWYILWIIWYILWVIWYILRPFWYIAQSSGIPMSPVLVYFTMKNLANLLICSLNQRHFLNNFRNFCCRSWFQFHDKVFFSSPVQTSPIWLILWRFVSDRETRLCEFI
jgi:hypothetical protein